MTDWNWFFSSLAQSAAAIVGIFGAFVITKILTNQAQHAQKMNRAREILAESQRVVDIANDLSIEWYISMRVEDELDNLRDLLEKDDSLGPANCYDKLNFPDLLDREKALQIITDTIEKRRCRITYEEEKKRKKAEERSKRRSLLGGSYNPPSIQIPPIPKISNVHMHSQMDREREAIDTVKRNARHQTRTVEDFLNSIKGDPESSPQITYALLLVTVLFYAGVIYPLSFLPAPADGVFELSLSAFFDLLPTIKGMLLVVTSAVFSAVLIMFFWLNMRLKYSEPLIRELQKFTELSCYSAHFETMEKNARTGATRHDK